VWVRALFENRLAVGLGFFSYSVFLIHQNIAYYMTEFLKKVGNLDGNGSVVFLLMMSAGLLAILAFSYVFFLLFEKPFMSGKRKPKPVIADAVVTSKSGAADFPIATHQ
jgi:peptidoglycan/LPS O-acetylase OafA/YrhL